MPHLGIHHRRRAPLLLARFVPRGHSRSRPRPSPHTRRHPHRGGGAAVSDTAVSLLTAPGTGAVATVEVRGPRAWELAKQLFTPAGKPLPESPEVNRFWFGTLGSDEVVLAATATEAVEVHCHGGRRVVRWVIEQFT